MRVERIGAATLHLGRCEDVLPELPRASALVSDPPWGIDLDTDFTRFSGGSDASRRRRGAGVRHDAIEGDDEPFDPESLLDFRECILWGSNHFSDKLPAGGGLVWLKRTMEGLGSFLSDAELAWQKGCQGVYCFQSYPQKMALERYHPTQKPVDLMTWCVRRTTLPVIDPYMGAGSTGVAATQLGRTFTGVEFKQQYFDIACRRIEDAQRQGNLFADTAA